jgi:hypothetical protein
MSCRRAVRVSSSNGAASSAAPKCFNHVLRCAVSIWKHAWDARKLSHYRCCVCFSSPPKNRMRNAANSLTAHWSRGIYRGIADGESNPWPTRAYNSFDSCRQPSSQPKACNKATFPPMKRLYGPPCPTAVAGAPFGGQRERWIAFSPFLFAKPVTRRSRQLQSFANRAVCCVALAPWTPDLQRNFYCILAEYHG